MHRGCSLLFSFLIFLRSFILGSFFLKAHLHRRILSNVGLFKNLIEKKIDLLYIRNIILELGKTNRRFIIIIFHLEKYLLKVERLEFHKKNFYLEINIASMIPPRMNTLPPKTRYFFRHNYFETASSRYTMKKNRIPRPLIRFIIRDYPKTDFLRDSCNRTALCYLQAELNEPTASFLSSGNSFTSYLRKVSTE